MATDAYAERVTHRRRPAEYVTPVLGLLLVGLILAWLAVNLSTTRSSGSASSSSGSRTAPLCLVALGYTLVYGILELINFAHGDVFMLGAMMAAVLIGEFGLTEGSSFSSVLPAILVALAVAMLGCGLINVTVERIAYKPLRNAPRLAPLITPSACRSSSRTSPSSGRAPRPCPWTRPFRRDGLRDRRRRLHVGPAVRRARDGARARPAHVARAVHAQGKAMRATAQDKDAAAMMGIDVNRTISFTFLIAGGLAERRA